MKKFRGTDKALTSGILEGTSVTGDPGIEICHASIDWWIAQLATSCSSIRNNSNLHCSAVNKSQHWAATITTAASATNWNQLIIVSLQFACLTLDSRPCTHFQLSRIVRKFEHTVSNKFINLESTFVLISLLTYLSIWNDRWTNITQLSWCSTNRIGVNSEAACSSS